VSVSSSIATCNYLTSAVHLITPTAGNLTLALTNCPSVAYRTINMTLLIDTTTNKVYANALTVNGTSRSFLFNNGVSNIPSLTTATNIVQNVCIVFGASSSVPVAVYTNISPYFA
jgi:hypothetical protein